MNIIDSFSGEHFFLSNFYRHPVTYEGLTYPTNEHAFQAAKTGRQVDRIPFLSGTATEAKRQGRQLKLREGWDAHWRYEVMLTLLHAKFQDSELRRQLRRTGDAILIEGNTWGDTTWGMVNGRGHNLLGWMLMQVRAGRQP